ncbi:hypothetical protein [Actinacidiphila acidipaludis]|uniref:Uncharacterized protein n=1 Tax=Actinacidiphila acidipaludis TaxID=2873382 RepID=A0ABS7Q0T9_9ACTN|nr:hypothetical protein [Streptomyces acidipaludis]MBY8876757.1 hypothetical protein [Streptomyces acidipaludis]
MSSADEPEPTPDAGSDGASEAAGTASPGSASPSGPVAGSAQGGSALVFDDPLDRPSPDDSDRGWGGAHSGSADDDFTRFFNEKPPHHL